ncbi:hypothetical protein [Noviherbaspirillum saxi]|uniref:Uncharacterized protein n=1 Tax=Noviherbaspirillum saxi TaxID=2320863 RepID=A0A3A3G4Y4_9BURK|nr:hypothetical protein [Noviherbaspirillum saxi]RJF95240.1 hypothetical protein D3871_17510 [Noviherbaspirillum saxi]
MNALDRSGHQLVLPAIQLVGDRNHGIRDDAGRPQPFSRLRAKGAEPSSINRIGEMSKAF